MLAEGEQHHCVDHFLQWLLARISPCGFAKAYAAEHPLTKESRIACSVILDDLSSQDVVDADSLFDAVGQEKMFGALLFPRVRYAEELTEVLSVLHASPRWRCTREIWRQKLSRPEDVPIGLQWRTAAGDDSSVMGFAPLGSMPVTRRAPYFALVVWPGGHDNEYAKKTVGVVGFIDGDPGVPSAAYETMKTKTGAHTRELLGDPPDDPILLRRVAFCLPRRVANPFLAGAGVGGTLRDRLRWRWRARPL